VKKVVIFILIFQLFVHPAMAQELIKLPALLEHFYHHNNHHKHHATHHYHHHDSDSGEEMGWFRFFESHYGNSAIRHWEDSHDQLPFKHSSDNRVEQLTIQLFIIEPNEINIHSVYEGEKKQYLICSSFLKSSYLQSIWQPPKIS
jgi:hypothetical protein